MNRLFRTKCMVTDEDDSIKLMRCLTATDIAFFGIGAIIGAGIFVLTGIAAATHAGPAVIISFIVAGLACGFTALAYAELASSIGGAGSAYTYAYVGFGELPAWIIGWDLLLEYAVSVATVASGWSGYFHNLAVALGFTIPSYLLKDPLSGGLINLPAMVIVLIVATLLLIGVKTSARFNFIMVIVKLSVIALFIAVAVMNVNFSNWQPFMPFGWSGVMAGAALIFFAYIGFDAVSTAAEEVINPSRNLPIGIIASLLICTTLYIVVSGLLTAIVPYTSLNVSSPISNTLLILHHHIIAGIIGVGAIAGLTTVILVMYYGLTRVFLAISRDQLLPKYLANISPKTRTPIRIIVLTGLITSCFAGLIPISDLAELVNIGTLAAFIIVCAGVIILRYTQPTMHRPFKAPLNPLFPGLGIAFCLYLMLHLPLVTWIRFAIWMVIGLLVYFSYSRFHSLMNNKKM